MAKNKEEEYVTIKAMKELLLETLGDKFEKVDSRLERIEVKLGSLGNLSSELEAQKISVKEYENRLDDIDLYQRRNNIILYNIPRHVLNLV